MAYLEVEDNHRMYYEHHRGDKRAVVLSHAWGMNGRLWDRVVPELVDDGHSVVVTDHRGCGRSDKDFDDYSVSALGGDLVKLVDALGLEGPVLNGWSLGGAVVTEAASGLGDRLGGLVLTCGASPRWAAADDFPQGNPVENAEQTLVGLRTARPDTAAAVSEAICHAPVSKTVVAWMAEMFVETSPRADESLADLAHNVDLRDKLPQIQAPALVFGGRHDVFVPYAIAETAAEMLPNARMVSCEESGHGVPIEEPDLYLRELRAFLGGAGMTDDTPFIGETIQVSTVTGDLYRALDGLVTLGIGPFMVFRMDPDNCVDFTHRGEPADYSMLVAFANAGGMMWEAIQPLEGTSVFSEFLAAGHEGLHHVAVSCNGVPFDERVAGLEQLGYECITGGRAFSGQVPFGYFHNGDPAAPIVEVFEFPDGFAPEPDEWYPAPPD